jgi:hypothetical protein
VKKDITPGEIQLTFRSPEDLDISGRDWFDIWGFVVPGRDERVYQRLIRAAKQGSLKAEDFELMGRWKDGAWTEGRWKPHVASVAYNTWKEIADKPPACPNEGGIVEFLDHRSNTMCAYAYGDGTAKKRFGLPRATTLLHFISAGRYPILDSRVRTALEGFKSHPGILAPRTSIGEEGQSYLERFYPLFWRIAAACGTDDARRLDQALMRYSEFLSEGPSSKFLRDYPPANERQPGYWRSINLRTASCSTNSSRSAAAKPLSISCKDQSSWSTSRSTAS